MEEKILSKKVVLFGDYEGVCQLLENLPYSSSVCAIVGAFIRSQYNSDIENKARELNIPFLIQPKYKSIEYNQFVNKLKLFNPDLLLCNSYSMIIRDDVRNIFKGDCINVHGSLLPKNRGPNPTQWAIIKGEKKTGATIHYMDNGLDTGDIIVQKEVLIADYDTWVDVNHKICKTIGYLLNKYLPIIIQGKNNRVKQEHEQSTANFRLTPEYPKIDFIKMNDEQIYNLIRAQVRPLKGAYVELENDGRLYIDSIKTFDEIKVMRSKYEK